jgi:hypothetical protein
MNVTKQQHLYATGKQKKIFFRRRNIFCRWLDVKEDDGLIVRELTLSTATQHSDKTTYHVNIKTGDISKARTDADVHLKIFGDKGETNKIRLWDSDNTKNIFERGRTDNFMLECDDLGKVCCFSLMIRQIS